MTLSQGKGPNAHLFQVEILIEGETNSIAFEKLLNILNRSEAIDFRITSGVELGRVIEQLTASPALASPPAAPPSRAKEKQETHKAAAAKESKKTSSSEENEVTTRILKYIKENRLIRLYVNKGLGRQLSIPCRIISLDQTKHVLTVYHVDEKQVYTFSLFEIDDFVE
ncbi:hypothetical protein [Paenibacillus sp. SYP-B4298]|uniref:hypothetical protein n=1 Tax=Paenibacillus sp. SYP-B4298 TaxID=2996034 RepID=UPI0022DE0D44|nr:hypothetical protein [Paenibacillus sp. SYP-B4298]